MRIVMLDVGRLGFVHQDQLVLIEVNGANSLRYKLVTKML